MSPSRPQANIHWTTARDLFCSVRFVPFRRSHMGRGYYVAAMNDGEERMCFWHGREAERAQAWLRAVAVGGAS